MFAAMLTISAPQAWMLDRSESVVRTLHQGPVDGRTSVWVRVTPTGPGGEPGPTGLVFVAEFPGRTPPPDVAVRLHVMSDVHISPLVPRIEKLQVVLDDRPAVDLLAPGEGAVIAHCCGDLISPIPIGATITLRPARLAQLAGASAISGNAFGVPFSLSAAQVQSIKAFRNAIGTP